MSVKLCKCGCGRESKKGSDFAYGHRATWEKNWTEVCRCGCGIKTSAGSDYLVGHRSRVFTTEELKARGEKISEAKQANPLTEEQRKHLSEINRGEKNPAYGKPVSEELRKKRGDSIKKRWADPEHHAKQAAAISAITSNPEFQNSIQRKRQEQHPAWNNNSSKIPRGIGVRKQKVWKDLILERDNNTCQLCNSTELSILCDHHINYIKYDYRGENLITLCKPCHDKTNWNRDHYTKLFTDLLNRREEEEDILSNFIAPDFSDTEQRRVEAIRAVTTNPEWQAKIQRRKGANHPHYCGDTIGTHLGISEQQKKKWQGKIFDRDDYTCQICNKTKDDGIVLCMHHINYIKTDFRDDNLITLCVACNNKSTWDRETYKETLTQKVNEILSTKSLPVGVGLSSKEATKIVLERDNNTCKICGRSEDMVLRVHSIDDTLDFVEENLITLCSTCNTNKMYRRKEFWKKTLSDIVKGVISPTVNELYALEQGSPVEVEKKAFGIGDTKRKQWRDKIFARDNNSCVVCKTTDKQLLMKQVNLQKNDFRDENLIVLCRTCESKLVKDIDNTRELITEYLNQVP